MPRRNWFLQLGFAAALAISLSSCAKNFPMNEQVEGIVTLDGKPLADAAVEFVPEVDPKVQAPISRGTTDEKGHFSLTCDNSKSGAVLGKHKIVVTAGRSESTDAKKGPVVPGYYSQVTKTSLNKEVTAEKHTGYDLELLTKAEAKPR